MVRPGAGLFALATALATDAPSAVVEESRIPYKNLGRCGATGRWGEVLEEKLFFLKTTKTAGSSIRSLFVRFARSERLAVLRSTQPGGVLFPASGASQQWVKQFAPMPLGYARPRSPLAAPYDVAYDHSTLDIAKLKKFLPGARWITSSREVASRVASAIALFKHEMDPAAYFGGCVRVDARGFCAGPLPKATQKNHNLNRIWNSVSWQLGAPTPAYNFGHRPLGETVDLLARIPTAPLVKLVDGAPTNETFVLVFLVERFEASLVLLRSLLCW